MVGNKSDQSTNCNLLVVGCVEPYVHAKTLPYIYVASRLTRPIKLSSSKLVKALSPLRSIPIIWTNGGDMSIGTVNPTYPPLIDDRRTLQLY